MKVLEDVDDHDFLALICKQERKFGLFLSDAYVPQTPTPGTFKKHHKEIRKAAPYLSEVNAWTLLLKEKLFILFDTEKEMNRAYEKTVGDDGPTKLNKYRGKVRIYAITCDNTGQLLNENT